MDSLIKSLEKVPISYEAIKRLGLPDNIGVVLYKNLSKGDLSKDAVIVLLENKEQRIGHFITIVKGREYFDSYGKSPQFAIQKTGVSDKLLEILPKGFIRNRVRLQKESGSVETCGLFCIARALFSNLSQREFLGLFRRQTHLRTPDDTITLMTLLLRRLMVKE